MWWEVAVDRHVIHNLSDQACLRQLFSDPTDPDTLDHLFRWWATGESRQSRGMVDGQGRILLMRGNFEAMAQDLLDRKVKMHLWLETVKDQRRWFPGARLIDRHQGFWQGVTGWYRQQPWIDPTERWVMVIGPNGEERSIGDRQGRAHKIYTVTEFGQLKLIFPSIAQDIGVNTCSSQ